VVVALGAVGWTSVAIRTVHMGLVIDLKTLATELNPVNPRRSPASKYEVTVVLFPVEAVAVNPSLF
jgi:hypothetical protein